MNLKTRSNQYLAQLGGLYDKTPKAVFAAIAYSLCFIDVQESGQAQAIERFLEEWRCLYDNGIVPQKPPKAIPTVNRGNVWDGGQES